VVDLWDAENVIAPPELGGNLTPMEDATKKLRENEMQVAAMM
jgi:hypothetical protein